MSGLMIEAAVSLASLSKFKREREGDGESVRSEIVLWNPELRPGKALAIPRSRFGAGIIPDGFKALDLALSELRLYDGVSNEYFAGVYKVPDLTPPKGGWSYSGPASTELLDKLRKEGLAISGNWIMEKQRAALQVEACSND